MHLWYVLWRVAEVSYVHACSHFMFGVLFWWTYFPWVEHSFLSVLTVTYVTSPPSFWVYNRILMTEIFYKVDFERKTSNFINIAKI